MKCTSCSALSILLLLAHLPGLAQQVNGKPVLSATPQPVSAPSVPPASSPTGPVAVDSAYVIGPDDLLQITVWKEPSYSSPSLPVRPDGMITLPLVGDVRAAGLTPMQLTADLTVQLKRFINEPSVSVSLLAVNSKHIYLVGEIAHIGPLPLVPGMSVLQAISTAGGLTPFANKKHLYILRGDPEKQTKILFDYKKALKGDMQGVSLLPGDTIVAP